MRVLIVSDIHGNYDALTAVLEHAARWDYLWVLGDLVDYGPEPHVVVDTVRALKPDLVVLGNHDYAVAYDKDCGCAPELHDLSEYTRQRISLRLLSREQLEWLKSLPTHRVVEVGAARAFVVHGSPRNKLFGYLKPSLPQYELMLALTPSVYAVRPNPVDAELVVTGHTHVQADFRAGASRVLNPGSVGQPRDGDWRAAFAVLETDSLAVSLYRVKYDVSSTVKKLSSLGIDSKYLARLVKILHSGSV
ncbi:MAG: metallophosphoesterase family protein [Sulfolobales archaeon]